MKRRIDLSSLLRGFWLLGVSDPDNVEIGRRARLLNLIILTGIIVFAIMGTVAYTEGNRILAYLDWLCGLLLMSITAFFYVTKRVDAASLAGIILMSIFFVHLFVTGGSNDTGYLWYFAFPLFTHFLLGKKRGVLVSLCLLLISYVIAIIDIEALNIPVRSVSFYVRFAFTYLLITLFTYYFEHFRDVAQKSLIRQRAEADEARQEAVRANAAKSEFLAKVSHELRTPLNHIIGFTDLLQNKRTGHLNDKQAEYLNDVSGSGKHLLGLIDDILDLSRVEAGKVELVMTTISVDGLVDDCVRAFEEDAQKNGILIRATGRSEALVRGDERRLTQVLYNLIVNAIKHSEAGGSITVTSRLCEAGSGGVAELAVSDTGAGIAPDDLERIFGLFERADGNSQRAGVGIGLSLSRSLINMHGGRIWAESPGPGSGSTFRIQLPVVQN